jgi:hypothetical protein
MDVSQADGITFNMSAKPSLPGGKVSDAQLGFRLGSNLVHGNRSLFCIGSRHLTAAIDYKLRRIDIA